MSGAVRTANETSIELTRDSHAASQAPAHTEGITAPTQHLIANPAVTLMSKACVVPCQIAFSLCVFQTGLDAVIISNALAVITNDLGSSLSQVAWIGSSYTLAWAAFLLAWAGIADSIGRKPVMLGGLGLFVVGSVMAAVAKSMALLLAGRAIQGLGGGACLSGVSFSINDMFDLRARAIAYAINSTSMCLAVAIGPLIGGALTSSSGQGWRWCFWINLPISGIAAILLVVYYHPSDSRIYRLANLWRIDWFGILLIMVAVVLLLLASQFGGSQWPWNSAVVITFFTISVLATAGFVVFEIRLARNPLIPHGMFRNRSIVPLLVVVAVHGFSYISCVFYGPLYFQLVLQASPLEAGTWQLASAIPLALVSILAGLWISRSGRLQTVIVLSSCLLTLGFGLYIMLPSRRDWAKIFSYQIIIALGIGPLFQAPLIALQAAVKQEEAAIITSILNLTRTLSCATGLVFGQCVLTNVLHHSKPTSHSTTDALDTLPGIGHYSPMDVTHAFRAMWIMYTSVCCLAVVASFFVGGSTLAGQGIGPGASCPIDLSVVDGQDSQSLVSGGSVRRIHEVL